MCRKCNKTSPEKIFQRQKSSKVPSDGWTMENFQSENGVKLVKDIVRVHRIAVTKNMPAMGKSLYAVMSEMLYKIVSQVEKVLAFMNGGRKAVGYIEMDAIWEDAVQSALSEYGNTVIETMQPFLQSTAGDIFDKNTRLLGREVTRQATSSLTSQIHHMATEVTSINETTRTRLARILKREFDKGTSPIEVCRIVKDQVPGLLKSRIPTIVRTELGKAGDVAAVNAALGSDCTHMSVIGCEAVEDRSPSWNGFHTCNIRNVPVGQCLNVRFHPNHTGTWIPSAFRRADGSIPILPSGNNEGNGTREEQVVQPNGSSAPFVNERPMPNVEDTPNPRGVTVLPQGDTLEIPTTPENCGAPPHGRPAPLVVDEPKPSTAKPEGEKPSLDRPNGMISVPKEELTLTFDKDDEISNRVVQEARANKGNVLLATNDEGVYKFVKATGMTPRLFEELITKGLIGNGVAKVDVVIHGEGAFTFKGFDSSGVKSFDCSRLFSYEDKEKLFIHHALFRIDPQYQNANIAKRVMLSSVGLYDNIGVNRIAMQANIDVGGYAWARYGFSPTSDSWNDLKVHISSKLELIDDGRILPLIDGDISYTSDVTSIRQKIVNSDNPKDIWAIAAMPSRVLVDGTETTLGKAMLIGSMWKGDLDMADHEAYARLLAYIKDSGGKSGRELYVSIDGEKQDAMLHADFINSKWGNLRADFAGMVQIMKHGYSVAEAMLMCASLETLDLIRTQLPQEFIEYLVLRASNE